MITGETFFHQKADHIITDASSGHGFIMMTTQRLHVLQVHPLLILFVTHTNSYGRLSMPCFQPSAPADGFPKESILICGSKGVLTLLIIQYLASEI